MLRCQPLLLDKLSTGEPPTMPPCRSNYQQNSEEGSMSYSTIAISQRDAALLDRVASAIAQEQKTKGEELNPYLIITPMLWSVVTSADVEAAYASALAADNPNPGGDESVITDGMILSIVQASWPV